VWRARALGPTAVGVAGKPVGKLVRNDAEDRRTGWHISASPLAVLHEPLNGVAKIALGLVGSLLRHLFNHHAGYHIVLGVIGKISDLRSDRGFALK
jgi:hypothetical protein